MTWEPRPAGRSRARQPSRWPAAIVHAAHVRYLAGESSMKLAAERGSTGEALVKAFHRVGLFVRSKGQRANPAPKVKPIVVRAKRPTPMDAPHRGECIYVDGACIGCERKRA